MQIFPVRDNFPPGFYEEFARLVVAFGRLEYLIKLCVKDLVDNGFTKGMVEAESHRQFSELCEKAKELANGKLNQIQFSSLLDQAIALAEFRNDTVHASWTTDPKGAPLRIRPKWDKSAKSVDWRRSTDVPPLELQKKREQIEDLYQALEAERKTWVTSTP